MNPGTAEQANREHFFSQVSSHLGLLYEHVRHQIAYLESTGDLVAGEVNVDDVVDTVLLRAFREFSKRPEGREIGSWLMELADGQLGREVRRSKAERRTNVHIEKDIPEVPPVEEVKTLGEEIFGITNPMKTLNSRTCFPTWISHRRRILSPRRRSCCAVSMRPWRECPRNGGVPCACAMPKG
jgi:DNA-directed RNA polymerase specialized sigma24 family protein